MSNFLWTILGAFILLLLSVIALAIGWLITGKIKLKKGSCSREDPTKKEGPCSLCGSPKECDKEKKE